MEGSVQSTSIDRRPRLPWVLSGIGFALAAAGLFCELHADTRPAGAFGPRGFAIPLAIVVGTVGAILASRRPDNPIGWVLCVGTIFAGLQALSEGYANWIFLTNGDHSTLSHLAATATEWTWPPGLASLAIVLCLFPDGKLVSPRWRKWLIAGVTGVGITIVATMLSNKQSNYPTAHNPLGVPGMFTVLNLGLASLPILLVTGAASVIVRLRRSSGDEREQMKWLGISGTLIAAAFVAYFSGTLWLYLRGGIDAAKLDHLPLVSLAEYVMVLGVYSIPLAVGFAVLKYRLYDIDVVIRKTVVFGFLVLMLTATFLAGAGLFGLFVAGRDTWVRTVAAFIVGVLVVPFWGIARRLADRWVFGGRATPYEVLTEFSRRAAEAYETNDALPRMAMIARSGVGASAARVWVRVGDELRVGASTDGTAPAVPLAGETLPDLPDDHAEPVFHRGLLLGAIGVTTAANDPITSERARLLADLASQAGAILANAQLIEELRGSRRRIVSAQDDRARKLERDIHDGAQQQLVALAVKLRLLGQLIPRDPAKAVETADGLQADVGDALENLRDLARGIYPPVLADKGLAAALDAQARKAPLPVALEVEPGVRFPQDVETAVYFSCLEALQNIAKYAEATRATITLTHDWGTLTFTVTDDGRGFDARSTTYGTGLQGISDRLAALGGSLTVESRTGSGTTLTGNVPA